MKLTFEVFDPGQSGATQNGTILRASGEIDLDTSVLLKEQLQELIDTTPHVVVLDLKDVTFIDSSGLGTLVMAYRSAQEHGIDLKLSGPRPQVLKVMQITGLNQVFEICENVQEAFA